MASELLKRKSLINRLKEPDVPVINFDLIDSAKDYNIESIEEDLLPEPKPQELLDLQEQNRKQRLSDSLQKIGSGLMDESVDFIKRNEMAIGGGLFSGTDLGTREGFGGIKYNLKALGGEGNQYIKTYNTKGGEKRYIAMYDRPGFNKKKTFPFTPEGLKGAREARDAFEKEYREIQKTDPERVADKSIRKLKDPPNPNKPWRYLRTGSGGKQTTTYYATEAEAKAAQNKVLEDRAKARFVSYKNKLPDIKRLLKEGNTIKQVSKKTGVPLSAIQNELGMIGKKASDFQPISYTEDPKLRKQFIDNYRKLSRSDLAKKLFPDDPPKTADAKYGKLRETLTDEGLVEPKKRGELSEERLAKVKTPFEAGKQKRDRRAKKLVKLGSKDYENSLTRFKTEIGRLLGIKEIKGPKISFMPLDLSHRSDIRLLSRLGDQKITPADLGLEFTEANRRGISRYKFGVKTLERKLEPLYAQQKRLYNKVAKDGISKSLSNLIEQNNNKIDNLFKTADPVIASKLNPVLMNAETGEPFRLTPRGGRTLFDIGKPLEDIELGGIDDFTIKRNYANQIVQVAKQEGLLDITDKQAEKIINKYFEDASTRAPIKTVKRTIAGQVQEIPRGTEGFVPNRDLLKEELGSKIPTATDSKNIAKQLASFGFKCSASEGGACDNPMNYLDDIKKQQVIATGSGSAATNAAKKLSAGRAIFREVLGPAALGFELAAAVPITYLGYKAGLPPARIISDVTYGLAGDTETARLKKIAVEEGIDTADIQKALDFEKATGAMQTLAAQEQDFRGPDDEMLFPQQYEKGEEDFYKAVGAFRDKEGNISKDVFQTISDQLNKIRGIAADQDAALAAEREADIDRTGIGDYLTTGIIPQQENILDVFDFQEPSTRMDLSEGGPNDPSRRTFLKFMAGIASLPFVGKFFKAAKAPKVVKLANTTTTMPDWFPAFIDKAFEKGIAKKIDADITEVEIPELPNVKVRKYDDGRIEVEGKNGYGEPYEIDYTPPGYELVDETTGKAVKTPGEFQANDTVYRRVGPEGDDFDVDFEVVDDVEQILGGDSTALEGFAKGTGKSKYTQGQRNIDAAEATQERADVFEGPDIDMSDYED